MTHELVEELRSTFLFENFSEEQLYWLAAHSTVETLAEGEYAFTAQEPPDSLWVLLAGEWSLSRTFGDRQLLAGTSGTPGSWAGWLPALDYRVAINMQATKRTRVLRIPQAAVEHMFVSGYPIARHLISGIYQGTQNLMAQTRQQEKMVALGKLSAGLAHELNNPASAARRAAADLRQALVDLAEAQAGLLAVELSEEQRAGVVRLMRECLSETAERPAGDSPDPLERADREEAVARWLDEHDVAGYDAATTLVDAGLDVAWLEEVAASVPAGTEAMLVTVLVGLMRARALTGQVEGSSRRISDLVAAVKAYSYMDQAAEQEVDVHEGLESTLTMLTHKLRAGVKVVRSYDPAVPRIRAAGSDLNQVWTNLIDNAVDAMHGAGTLRVATRRDGDDVIVEIGDSGPGIPADVQTRIFEPFFTTKDVGEGSGLGLDIVYRIVVTQHHGDISVTSEPGSTTFSVRLPINSAEGAHTTETDPGDGPQDHTG